MNEALLKMAMKALGLDPETFITGMKTFITQVHMSLSEMRNMADRMEASNQRLELALSEANDKLNMLVGKIPPMASGVDDSFNALIAPNGETNIVPLRKEA